MRIINFPVKPKSTILLPPDIHTVIGTGVPYPVNEAYRNLSSGGNLTRQSNNSFFSIIAGLITKEGSLSNSIIHRFRTRLTIVKK